ncbi:Monooxygenase FAD-binding [Penicillium robsamsonii]|uniref:Monooxygenase FAD-binding n=1 Tax=Penicillium robsamsonii TaxID=1792511 RepID=UPI0025489E61|nr:Monooxygenase FAD-binding [Penicillium robsamsonii]KAJ5807698.1 Monooxygenase FAD-binding [Penicillium robsamsonii]
MTAFDQPLEVLVIGAGIAGLSAAIALGKQGHHVVEWYLVHRVELHNHLKQRALETATLHTRCKVTEVNLEGACPSVTLADGRTFQADLLIGADGLHSQIRQSIAPGSPSPYPVGKSCFRWLLPTDQLRQDASTVDFVRDTGVFIEWASDDRRLVAYPCSDSKILNLCAFVPLHEVQADGQSDSWQAAGDKATIVKAFSKFSPGVQQIIASADRNLKVWDLYDMEALPTWTRDHAALLGDAAHPFQPYMGQGAAMAIEDAISIATLLPYGSTPHDIPMRLEMYQKARRPRVDLVLHYTRINGRDEKDVAGDRISDPNYSPDSFRVRRKPVSNPNLRATAHADQTAYAVSTPSLVPPPLSQPPSYTDLYGPPPRPVSPGSLPRPRTAGPTSSPTPPPTPVQKAYSEARHFLTGLINRPTESNKHVTILRHSHGLVFYRGPTTSVAISIFSDVPLPPEHTLWLQSKGWTGKTGMQFKSLLRLRDSWLDVTPGMPLRADQVIPDDERAWQRDIKKFLKKAPSRPRDTHQLRETAVVRIPAEAGDGYFQLVLCQGLKKKVLGNSPVFRVLSTSTAPSSIRGASLSTLPLEVGAMVLSLYAHTAARTVAGPAAVAIQSKAAPFQAKAAALRPSWVTKTVAQKAYATSGIENRVGGIINGPKGPIGRSQINPAAPEIAGTSPVSIDVGPQPPFPMTFKARCQTDQISYPNNSDDTPKLNLIRMPDWVTEQLRGYFFGWARFDTGSSKGPPVDEWYPAILSVRALDPLQAARVNLAQISKRVVAIRLLEDVPLQTSKVEIRVLGYLRAEIPPPTGTTSKDLADAQAAAVEAALLADVYDASVVQDTLAHPAWAVKYPAVSDPQQNSSWIDRTVEGYTNIITRGQKLVEQVPLHLIGVRSVTDEIRESHIAVNGFYIVR